MKSWSSDIITLIPRAVVCLLAALPPLHALAQADANWVRSTRMLDSTGVRRAVAVDYADGLGRPFLHVDGGVGGEGQNVYTYTRHAGLAVEAERWLPVPGPQQPAPLTRAQVAALCAAEYGDTAAQAVLHTDALGRTTLAETPGAAWRRGHRGVSHEYLANGAGDVKRYRAPVDSNTLIPAGYYDAGTLRGERTVDEDGVTLTTYTDRQGRKVLERRGGGGNGEATADTYFVHDDLGRLRFVLTPRYQESGLKSTFGYEYRYDRRDRLAKRILLGCQYEQFWYDDTDRLTFMQDAALRAAGKYRFTLYDRLGRKAVQGLCTGCDRAFQGGRAAPRVALAPGTGGLLGTGYALDCEGLLWGGCELEAAWYYDNYAFLSADAWEGFPAFAPGAVSRGLPTGTLEAASDGSLLRTATAYDDRGRPCRTAATTLGGRTASTETSYTFTGNPEATAATLRQGAREILGVTERRTYNPHNDLPEALHVAVAADGATAADTVATHAYDALGRLARTRRGGAAGQLEYGYEMHGWPTAIRRGGFEERLAYAEPDVGAPRYNGSVSVQRWKTPVYAQVRGYRFAYDAMGRLTAAEYGEREGLDNHEHRYDEAVLAYDLNGGIERMQRRGRKQDGEYGKTDNLHIRLSGNRPVAVEDDAAPLLYEGAIDVPSTDGTPLRLAYDARGALTDDATRGVCLVEYDLPGWPRRVQFADGSVTEFVYGASGTKLRTVHLTAVPGIAVAMGERRELLPAETLAADTTDYAGAVTLRNGVPVRVDFEGGYCSIESPGSGTGTGGTGQQQIRFHYYPPDHLGNIREVVGGDGTLEQVTDYYPFGTPYYDGTGLNPSLQTRKFGGKELDLTHGYVNYDFGARGYNPLLGVWDRMDLIANCGFCF